MGYLGDSPNPSTTKGVHQANGQLNEKTTHRKSSPGETVDEELDMLLLKVSNNSQTNNNEDEQAVKEQ